MTGATLNPTTGTLTLEGIPDLEAVRREARKENYTVRMPGEQTANVARSWASPEFLRAVLSAAALAAGYMAGKLGGTAVAAIPFYAVAAAVGGWGNLRRAYRSLPRLDFNMSVLMSAAVLGAMAIGQWEEGAVVAFLYSVSELLESWTLARARQSIRQLMDLAPRMARVRRPGGEEAELPVEAVRVGDVIVVRPGEKIAMDGRILRGESAVNQAAITGESVPVEKHPGDAVFAGTLNTYGSLEVEVTRLVQDTTLAKIIHLVEEAQARRAPSQAFIDRFAAAYTPTVLALAGALAVVPPLLFGLEWSPWIYRGLSLLVVACPCALVVSTPVAIVSAIAGAARHGVLIKGGIYLEEAGQLTAVAFDKTGTLTRGRPAVKQVIPLGPLSEAELLQLATSLESRSEHPLAEAVVRSARECGLTVAPVEGFRALPGLGTEGRVGGQTFYAGSLRLFEELGVDTGQVTDLVHRLQEEGHTVILVGTQQRCLGVIAVADEVREGSRAAVAALKQAGIRKTILLTGDHLATARAMAAQVGVDEYRAGLLPHEKVAAVEELLRQYGKVAMVGDGINDAPALARATVGIAMGGAGSDTALETADIVLMADDLTRLPFTVHLSRAALRVIRQNITFSLAVKALAVLAVFPGWLTLWLAILADMGASILVTLNGIRLLAVRPERP